MMQIPNQRTPPEELDTQVPDKQRGVENQLVTSLLLVRRGWFANHALQRTAPRITARAFCERSGSYICASVVRATVGHAPRHAPPSLSLGSLGHSERFL